MASALLGLDETGQGLLVGGAVDPVAGGAEQPGAQLGIGVGEVAVVGERGLGDVELEVLGHLVLADDLAHAHADRLLGAQASALALRRGGNGSEQRFGGL